MTKLAQWFYDLTYRTSKPRWDSDKTPPELKAMVGSLPPNGRILDLGCGTGTNAIYLAEHGFDVTAVDFSKTAIEMARKKAQHKNASLDFWVADVTKLDFLETSFDLVFDLGCLHSINQEGRQRYAQHVIRLTRSGSRLMVWAFNGKSIGIGVDPGELQKLFEPAFTLDNIESGYFHNRSSSWYWFHKK